MDGYIKLNRSMLEWGWYLDVPTKATWIHLLLRAAYKPNKYMGEKLLPGDVVIGYNTTPGDIGISCQQFRTALEKLEKTGEITRRATSKFTVVHIVKWRVFQDCIGESNKQITSNQQANNKQSTSEQQAINKQITSNQQANNNIQEIKKVRNIKKNIKKKNAFTDFDQRDVDYSEIIAKDYKGDNT